MVRFNEIPLPIEDPTIVVDVEGNSVPDEKKGGNK